MRYKINIRKGKKKIFICPHIHTHIHTYIQEIGFFFNGKYLFLRSHMLGAKRKMLCGLRVGKGRVERNLLNVQILHTKLQIRKAAYLAMF